MTQFIVASRYAVADGNLYGERICAKQRGKNPIFAPDNP